MSTLPLSEGLAPVLPPQVVALIEAKFGGERIGEWAATFGGFSNLTAAATIGGRRLVIKAADSTLKRADLRREARMLTLLEGSGLPTAQLIGLLEDEQWSVELLECIAGISGMRLFDGPPEALPAIYGALGRLLAQVHTATLPAAGLDQQLYDRSRQVHAALPDLPLDPQLRAALTASLEHPVWHTGRFCLVHGDAGLHNMLWESRITALLDWEWAGWGNPLLDLAWVQWTQRLRKVPAPAWQAFLEGYGELATPDLATPQALDALVLGQIAAILLRSNGRPAAWQEWLRRARWTLWGIEN